VATIGGLTGPRPRRINVVGDFQATDARPWMVKLAIDVKAKESGSGR
jgi:hypothetical protein